jgi:UDP-glucose 4-epimerase
MYQASILVTGAAGFIGSHVCEALLAEGHRVIALDDLSGGFRANVPSGVRFEQGSILDAPLLGRIFASQQIDYVYHLAAYAAEGLSHYIRAFNYTNNLIGSAHLINLAVQHDVKCFVFTSSIAVYGRAQIPMGEDTIPLPEDPYGIAKRAVELDLDAAHRLFGLNYIVFRPHNVFGERQNIADPYRNVVGIFMNQILRSEPMTIFGDGTQTRSFTYVGDILPILTAAIRHREAYNQTFNIGADGATSVGRLAELVAEAMGVPPVVRYLSARQEVEHAIAAHTRAERVFGHQSRWSLQDGLTRMAAWVRATGPRAPVRFDGIEIDRNLPEGWAASVTSG